MRIFILLWFSVRALSVFAAEPCTSTYWTFHGDMIEKVSSFDKLLVSWPDQKDPIATVNAFIKKQGLLLQLRASSDIIPGYSDYLSAHGVSGDIVGMFFKRMQNWSSAKISFDTVYEIEKPEATRVLKRWNVPMGTRPLAIEGFDMIYSETLTAVCQELTRKVSLEVSNEGNFRAIARDSFPATIAVPEQECRAQRALFPHAAYTKCMQFVDLKSGVKRTLVWNEAIK